MKQLLARIWAFYSKNTFVRHAASYLAAFAVLEYAQSVSDVIQSWLHNPVTQGAVGSIAAAGYRKAQTWLELKIAALIAKK